MLNRFSQPTNKSLSAKRKRRRSVVEFNLSDSEQDSSYDSDHENLTGVAVMGGGVSGGTASNVGSGGGGGSLDLIPAPVGGGGGGGGGGLAPLTIPAPGSSVMSRSHNDVSRCSEYQTDM